MKTPAQLRVPCAPCPAGAAADTSIIVPLRTQLGTQTSIQPSDLVDPSYSSYSSDSPNTPTGALQVDHLPARTIAVLAAVVASAIVVMTIAHAAPISSSVTSTILAQAPSESNSPLQRSPAAPTSVPAPANATSVPTTNNGAGASSPAASSTPASTIYRQVLPNGSTVYSDQPLKGVKVERELSVAPLIKGNGWTTENLSGPNPAQSQSTPIKRRSNNSETGAQRTREDAQSDVMRAEMLLEDAKLRQSSGAEPLPGERTGTVSGKSRLNQAYHARQEALERDVAQAQSNLQQAISERNNLR